MLDNRFVTLTTDYGLRDSFVGMIKGVLFRINPQIKIIDITHNIQRHDIRGAANVIGMSYNFFPPATIHICVVDPGVGGQRRPILVTTENHYFIGPDNGVFSHVFEKEQDHFFKVIHITASHYFLSSSGATFHGRDVFAPVAGWLSKGLDSAKFGEPISDFVRIPLHKPTVSDDGTIHGEVISFDHFGNAITNITAEYLEKLAPLDSKARFRIMFRDNQLRFLNYYAESEGDTLSGTVNGFGHLELFVNQKNAAEAFGIRTGDPVSVMIGDRV